MHVAPLALLYLTPEAGLICHDCVIGVVKIANNYVYQLFHINITFVVLT